VAAKREVEREKEKEAEREKKRRFIPNKYIAAIEKSELVQILWHNYFEKDLKQFIDPRHKEIYRILLELRRVRGLFDLDDLITALEKEDPELYGGIDFVMDIFRGIPGRE
jgi:hypothetical protein